MATRATRTARARATESIVAERLRHLYPLAARVPASLPGRDILGTPGLAVEVKARRDLDLTGWLAQAKRNAGTDLPVVVIRPDGYGPERVDFWPVVLTMVDFVALLERARL